jgi:DNA (cytosine-5)-methyltransferase 1
MTIKFGSVCSGIEAASMAWHPLGWQAAWLSEIEPFPSAVLAHHYPDVPNLGDMTTLPNRIRCGEIEAPDVFCGGTPCVAFSVAGLRNGLDDPRGALSLIFCEIANAIDSVRRNDGREPSIVFWENVPGILSSRDNAFGCFLAGLAGEDDPLIAPGGKWADAGCVFGPERTVAWRILDAQYFGLAQRRKRVFVVASARDGFDPVKVLFEFDGVRRDSAPSREAGEIIARSAEEGARVSGEQPYSVANCLTARMHKGINTTLDEGQTPVVAFDTTQITSAANYSNPKPGDACHPLAAGAHPPAIAFHPTQDPISSTDGTTHAMGCGSSGGQASVAVAVALSVRRLTVEECETLQGFPRGFTAIPWRKKPADQCPDGPRYKALGNSWAVPVVNWIGNRIQNAINETENY